LKEDSMAKIQITSNDDQWRYFLAGTHPALTRNRHLYGLLPANPRCKWCNAPFAGPGAAVMRMIGKRPSRLNPRYCNICDRFASQHIGGAEIELSMVFADIRGSTTLAEQMSPAEFSRLIDRFYREATDVLVRFDALIDKLAGDQVSAYLVPGFTGPAHAEAALQAARQLLRATGHSSREGAWIPVGVGVHTGTAFVGAVGSKGGLTDVTALGDAVNTAARLASNAGPGEILASEATCQAAGLSNERSTKRALNLKGKSEPVNVRVLTVD
jgi:adenylate cyclase